MYLIRRSGLGDAACPEPVSGEERDKIRKALGRFAKDWAGQAHGGIHWHEGHPDIKAYLADICPRMLGLYGRPKLIRCSKEARIKAEKWTDQVHDLLTRVKSRPANYSGFTTVKQAFDAKIYNGPTYRIRASNHPDVVAARTAEYQRIEQRKSQGTPTPTGPAPTEPAPIPVAATIEDLWVDITTGQVFGVEKRYITYAVIGLLGYDLVFRRLWK